jgi:hypothetical protein
MAVVPAGTRFPLSEPDFEGPLPKDENCISRALPFAGAHE